MLYSINKDFHQSRYVSDNFKLLIPGLLDPPARRAHPDDGRRRLHVGPARRRLAQRRRRRQRRPLDDDDPLDEGDGHVALRVPGQHGAQEEQGVQPQGRR